MREALRYIEVKCVWRLRMTSTAREICSGPRRSPIEALNLAGLVGLFFIASKVVSGGVPRWLTVSRAPGE